jgi:hypothetical protein
MAEKIEPTACDGRLSEVNSNNQPALYGAFASESQGLIGDVSAAAMDAVVVGIDPGAHGAIAVLTEAGQLLGVFDMPSTPEANGRAATNANLACWDPRADARARRFLRIRRRTSDRCQGRGIFFRKSARCH